MKSERNNRRLWKPYNSHFNPWARREPVTYGPYQVKRNHFGRFDDYIRKNKYLDLATKNAALKASPYVVCLTSYIGIQRLFMCSGLIVNSCEDNGAFSSTILTSASLLRCPEGDDVVPNDVKVDVFIYDYGLVEGEILGYDFHYNVAAITVKSGERFETALIGNSDNPVKRPRSFASFQLLPHRETLSPVELRPGSNVIALGRFFDHPYHVMAASGKLSMEDCGFDCKELQRTSCKIVKNGIGGPLISCNGYVIGMNFYAEEFTPFIPIKKALQCLEQLQKYRRVSRPWLGLKLTDIQMLELGELEKLNQSFPNTIRGVIVREVESGGPASVSGLCAGDIIVELDGKPIRNSAEFDYMVLEKAQEPMEANIKRVSVSSSLTLTLLADNASSLNRWPIPEEYEFTVVP